LNYLFVLNQFTNEWIIFLNEQELSASLRYALSLFGIQKKLFTRLWTGLEQINQANLVFLDYISQTMAYYPNTHQLELLRHKCTSNNKKDFRIFWIKQTSFRLRKGGWKSWCKQLQDLSSFMLYHK
jgi:hypothetical protein